MKCLLLPLVVALLALAGPCRGGSYSKSCVYVNGVQQCSEKSNPNGNFAGSSAVADGRGGRTVAGAGDSRNGFYEESRSSDGDDDDSDLDGPNGMFGGMGGGFDPRQWVANNMRGFGYPMGPYGGAYAYAGRRRR